MAINNYKKPVVLLVENNPDDVELTRRAFLACGVEHELVIVWDGEEALDYLFATGSYSDRGDTAMPHLVLLDLSMPKQGGMSVLKALRDGTNDRSPPVVMLTSSNQQSDVRDSYHYGANSYIQKPVDFRHFVSTVQMLAQYWLVVNVVEQA